MSRVNYFFWSRKFRLPVVRQTERGECGLACLAMISSYFGAEVHLAQLRVRFPPSALGTRLSVLVKIGEELGLRGRAVSLMPDQLARLTMPAILHWRADHYVVLSKIVGNRAVIHDPALGATTLSLAELGDAFAGVALELAPDTTFKSVRAERIPSVKWMSLAGRVDRIGRAIFRSFMLAVAIETVALLQPFMTGMIIDKVIPESNEAVLIGLASSVCLLAVCGNLFSAVRSWAIVHIQTRLSLSAASSVFAHLIKLPASYFERRRLGDVVARFNTIGSIQQVISTRLVEVLLDGVVGCLTLVMMFCYKPLLAAVPLIALLLYSLVKLMFFPGLSEANAKRVRIQSRQQNRIIEGVRLAQTIRVANAHAVTHDRFVDLSERAANSTMDVQKVEIVSATVGGVIADVERVLVLGCGAMLALHHEFTLGALVAFIFYSSQFSVRSRHFVDYVAQLYLLNIQRGRLADIVHSPIEQNLHTAYVATSLRPVVRFENVSFRYSPDDRWIVRNLSFEIAEGTFVAIVGPSGCGKSTLMKLLIGVMAPGIGSIKIDGVPIEKVGLVRYRDMLGVALQDSEIFSGSVIENISLFDDGVSLERVERLCQTVLLHTEIAAMPMGYNTRLGGIDSYLSAGQKQRLLLARALYRQPKILVLDEATCHIDVATEAAIFQNLKALNVTRIVVTHRHEAAKYADRVFDLRKRDFLAPEPTPGAMPMPLTQTVDIAPPVSVVS
jgi:ATP-binding cassette subfamily B protein RaxB